MLQKKVCMLGTFAVGKTSLVRRFVDSIYSDEYHTTIGVKIDKKVICANEREMTLVLWDIYGRDDFQSLRMEYLRGMSGYLLVADGTRRNTVQEALSIAQEVEKAFAKVPFICLLNKADLQDEWEVGADTEKQLIERGWSVMRSSAKTGHAVESAFEELGRKMLS
jgi:small GTP-binding protein